MPERYRETHPLAMARVAATGQSRLVGQTVELFGVAKEGREFPTELSLASWRRGESVFFAAIIRDITQRKQAEAERERLIKELTEALANVKTLRGLLPICSGCKKIRDDQGYWSEVDSYIRKHTEAKFSHGLCPDCLRKYYPDVADEVLEELARKKASKREA
jgi:hypothetical protein